MFIWNIAGKHLKMNGDQNEALKYIKKKGSQKNKLGGK